MFGVAVVLLGLCFVPHIGMKINGSPRWIHLGPACSSLANSASSPAIVALAWWFTKFEAKQFQFSPWFCFADARGQRPDGADLEGTRSRDDLADRSHRHWR